jgi:hypothetical protein
MSGKRKAAQKSDERTLRLDLANEQWAEVGEVYRRFLADVAKLLILADRRLTRVNAKHIKRRARFLSDGPRGN